MFDSNYKLFLEAKELLKKRKYNEAIEILQMLIKSEPKMKQ